MNRNVLVNYGKKALMLVLIAGVITAAAFALKGILTPKTTTVLIQTVERDTRNTNTIPEYKPANVTVKADKKVDDSAVIGGTPFSSIFRQGGYNKGADGKQYLYSLNMNTAHVDLNVNNGYKYLKGKLVLSDYSKARTYLRAQIMIYDVGSNQPFYVSSEMTEDNRADIDLLVDLSGHERIRIEIPYFRDLYLATDGLYFSDTK